MIDTCSELDKFKSKHIIFRNRVLDVINGKASEYRCSDFEPSACSCSFVTALSMSDADIQFDVYQRMRKLHLLFHMYAYETVLFYHNAGLESSRLSRAKMEQTLNKLLFITPDEPGMHYPDSIEGGLKRINSLLVKFSARSSSQISADDINARYQQYISAK
jgi:hypothetical protein